MIRFICDDCGRENLQDIICHGHKISYNSISEQFICKHCSDKVLSQREIEECIPQCCHKEMIPSE